MPEGLEGALTPQQFADLIAYLASLKVPQSTAAALHGMPPEIPELKIPRRAATGQFSRQRIQTPCLVRPGSGASRFVCRRRT